MHSRKLLWRIGRVKVTKKERAGHSGILCFVMSMVWILQEL